MDLDALRQIKNALVQHAHTCDFCPRFCNVDRINGETGFCNMGRDAQVASVHAHFGEEPPLVGHNGSGTVFFFGCNLGCVFCQNYEISHGNGSPVQPDELASIFLTVQRTGCHNLNLVTPTPHILAIVEALEIALTHGFHLPVVYNCGGYENPEIIKLLNGIIDIYMPDLKSLDRTWSRLYLKAADYPVYAKLSIEEMYKQVGNLRMDAGRIAKRGLLVRHLVMPNQIDDTRNIIDFLRDLCGTNGFINVMNQYRPCFEAGSYSDLNRRISQSEWQKAIDYATKNEITKGLDFLN